MNLWWILGYKQTPLRSVNWAYLSVVNAWNYLKTVLTAYHDDEGLSSTRRRLSNTAASPPEPAMASVVAQESSDLRLSLPVEKPSTSPFPSPGSPFYPPPRLGAHEFASRPSSSSSSKSIARNSISPRDDPPPTMAAALVNGESTPTTATLPPPSVSVSSTLTSPATPTPNSMFQVKTPTTQITVPDPPPDSDSQLSLAASALTIQNRDSLTSSRPAPPSPAASRRASAALSRRSSAARSNRQSKSSLLQVSHEPEASSSSAATVTSPSQQPKRRSWVFKIRDFAYDPSDERHIGCGPDAPRANRPRQRWSTYSTASSSSATSSHAEDDDDTGEDARGSWGAYRWNTLSNHFSWGPGQGPADGPSHNDFARNFDASSPTDETSDPYSGSEPDDAYEGEADDGPLVPGLYKALYAFEPEGTAEMALEEEQIVRVVGRGGGVGWAVVEKEGGGHALVPESYLELVEAD
ncbi:hypothetical protein PYCCODRAFT_1452456 [Trametes coccinea BRFM310]|uniref:SH3 domain-containing protein n=1 Tax=Trametes coccinea (strain BRFM310) TaxID=1353009 RepID=A0A1Y2IL56_TRAC3|nr:hypothetical protein PYCCODRAFT_1452456 [Trametes coccinea BRFM310]